MVAQYSSSDFHCKRAWGGSGGNLHRIKCTGEEEATVALRRANHTRRWSDSGVLIRPLRSLNVLLSNKICIS